MLKVKIPEARAGVGRAPSRLFGRLGALRWPIAVLGVVLLAIAIYLAYTQLLAPKAPVAAAQTTFDVRRGNIASSISATGTVAPLTQAKLSFRGTGRISEVSAKVGDRVTRDQPLAKLDTTELALKVSQSRAQLSTAQAKLANVKAGSRSEEIRSAQLQLDAAKAKLEAMLAGGRPEDVATARASLSSAQAKLSQLKKTPTPADLKAAEQSVAAAQASLQKAQADLAKLRAGPTAEEIRGAELAVEQAKASLWSSQTSRDGTCGSANVREYQCNAANASVSASEVSLAIAQNNLAKLKTGPKPEDVAAAEQAVTSAQAQLASAQAKLDQVTAGPTAEDLAAAQAAVVQAEQALLLKQKPYTEADIQAQRQAVAQAEAALASKQAPYTEADLQSAQAAVDQAKAQLELDEYNLANAVLVAPFDGVVHTVGYNVGEVASGSANVVVVDPRELRLDVNVDETDIARLEVGQKTNITFDPIAGRTFQGKVISVAPSAAIQSGVATYLVSISIPDAGPIRPGMTGNASIVYGEKENALLVPNRAIRTQGRNRVVEVAVGDQRELRQVTVGVTNDQFSEVTEGLAEGDKVVIQATRSLVPGMGGAQRPGQPAPGQPVMVPKS